MNSREIQIINSKWNRSHTIVMSDDMQKLAKKYANIRDLKYPECKWFFPANSGSCYTSAQIQNRFKKFYELSRPDIPKELLPENLTKSAGIDWENLNAIILELASWEE